MTTAMQSPRQMRTGLLLALLAGVLGTAVGCGSEKPPRPSASDGLAYLLQTSEGGTDVASVRLSDGSAQMLTATPAEPKGNLQWSSAVQRLVFTRSRPGEEPPSPRIMLFDLETGVSESASDRSGPAELDVAISPDGKRLVFVFEGVAGGGISRGVKILRLMTAGEGVVGAPQRGTMFRRPQLSPDSLDVAVEVRARARSTGLAMLAPNGAQRPLVDEARFHDTRPRFSRSGERIYFQRAALEAPGQRARRAEAGVPGPLGGGDVCEVDVRTLEVRCIAASEDAREHGIEPSPTRDEVVFIRQRAGAGVEVVLADLSGEAVAVLATLPAEEAGSLRWSPDGELVALVSGSVSGSVSASQAASDSEDAVTDATITVIDRQGHVRLETPGFAPTWAPPVRDPGAS